jgi:hypothetical protein
MDSHDCTYRHQCRYNAKANEWPCSGWHGWDIVRWRTQIQTRDVVELNAVQLNLRTDAQMSRFSYTYAVYAVKTHATLCSWNIYTRDLYTQEVLSLGTMSKLSTLCIGRSGVTRSTFCIYTSSTFSLSMTLRFFPLTKRKKTQSY